MCAALGQIMLYIDGMQGVMRSASTVEWLYSLLGSKYPLVAKTAIKLLLVFVEYTDANCVALVRAVTHYHQAHGALAEAHTPSLSHRPPAPPPLRFRLSSNDPNSFRAPARHS